MHCKTAPLTANQADRLGYGYSISFMEVQAAKAVFLKKLQQNRAYTRHQLGSPLYMSPKTAMACALAEVWRQGRIYQRDRNDAALMELAKMVPWA